MISLGMNSFINAQGFARMGMLTILIGAILNIILGSGFYICPELTGRTGGGIGHHYISGRFSDLGRALPER